MVGDYNFTKLNLQTDKLAGGHYACMGFLRRDKHYVPNTLLNEDIRLISKKPTKRVLAILRKPKSRPCYNELCYLAKNIIFDDIKLDDEVRPKIDLD